MHDELTKLIVAFLKAADYIDVKFEDHTWDVGPWVAQVRPEPSPTPANQEDWDGDLNKDWDAPKDIGLEAEVEWEDVITIED